MKKHTSFIAVFLVAAISCLHLDAQVNRTLDSMMQLLASSKPDTSRVKLYKDISYNYSRNNPDSGYLYAGKAMALSKKLGWKKGKAWAHNCYGLNDVAVSKYEQAEKNFNKAYAYNKELGFTKGMAHNKRNLALVAAHQYRYSEAVDNSFQARALYRNIGDIEGEEGCNNNIGVAYLDLEEYAKALPYFESAYQMSSKLSSYHEMVICLNNLSYTKRELKNLDQAMQYAQQALELSQRISDNYCLALSHKNLGACYAAQGDWEPAMSNYRKGLSEAKLAGNKYQQARVLELMAKQYDHQPPKEANRDIMVAQAIDANYTMISSPDSATICRQQAAILDPGKKNEITTSSYNALSKNAYNNTVSQKTATQQKQLADIAKLEKAYNDKKSNQ